MHATDRRQQPFVYGSLSRNAIYLAASTPTAAAVAVPPASPAATAKAEDSVWETIRASKDAKLFENFVSQFPNSPHLADARSRLEAVRSGSECDRLTAQVLRSVGTVGAAPSHCGAIRSLRRARASPRSSDRPMLDAMRCKARARLKPPAIRARGRSMTRPPISGTESPC